MWQIDVCQWRHICQMWQVGQLQSQDQGQGQEVKILKQLELDIGNLHTKHDNGNWFILEVTLNDFSFQLVAMTTKLLS